MRTKSCILICETLLVAGRKLPGVYCEGDSSCLQTNSSLTAQSGLTQGKVSRRLRRLDNAIPAILYGGNKDPMALTIAHDDILHATANEAFFSHIITLNIGKDKVKAVIKALQRHPAKPFIMHADFLRVDEKQAITVKVPLHFINEDKCVGVKLGSGSIRKTLNEIEISCLPSDLPEYIEVDMLEVEVGQTLQFLILLYPKALPVLPCPMAKTVICRLLRSRRHAVAVTAWMIRMLRVLARMTLLQMIQVTAPIARPIPPAR